MFSAIRQRQRFLLVTAGLLVLGERLRTGTKPPREHGLDRCDCGRFVSDVCAVARYFAQRQHDYRRPDTRLDARNGNALQFLLGAPIIFGAGMLGLLDLRDVPNLSAEIPVLLTIFIIGRCRFGLYRIFVALGTQA